MERRRENQSLRGLVWGITLICALGTTPLQSAVMEEVVVTAQKRDQSIQDVGIAVSAVTGEQMRALGFTNAQQVTALAPGVSTIQPNGESNYAIGIRGVVNSDFTTNVESPVAIYLDEAYISQMSGTGFMLFDMERVEILRGPQGTLYGRNATGGLAHYVTRKPGEEFDGYGQLTFGSYGQLKIEGAVGGPITDQFAARLSLSSHKNDGYVENRLNGDDLNNADDQAGRLQLLFTPSDRGEILLNFRASQQDIDTGFFEHVSANQTGVLTPNEVNNVLGYIDNDGDPFEGDYDGTGFNDLETWGASATVKWDFDNFGFTSITDFQSVERDYIEDSDASPVPLFRFFLTTDSEQFSQEFRFDGGNDRMNWVAGLYYLDIEIDDSNGAETEPFIDPAGDTPDVSGLDNPYTSEKESISVFGQLDYRFNEQFEAIFGLRFIRDEHDFAFTANAVDFIPGTKFRNGNPNVLANLATYSGDRSDSEWAARLGLNWTPNDDLLIYGSINRGVKGGGFNAPIFPLNPPLAYTDQFMSYDPEQLTAFEVGFKSTLVNGLVFFNGAAFYYDYEDYQAFQIIGIDTITSNTEADAQGFELELQAAPTEGLDILLGAGYTDIDVDLNGFGTTSVQTPNWNLNGLVRYEFPLADGKIAVQADAQYRSEHYFALTRLETVEEDGYTVTNASVSYTSADARWTVSAFVHNLTDEEYLVQTFDLSGPDVFGMVEQYYGRPRWAGVSVGFDF